MFPRYETRQILTVLMTLLLHYLTVRVVFGLANSDYLVVNSSTEALNTFSSALRFDLATIALITGPLFIALALGARAINNPTALVSKVQNWLFWLILLPHTLGLLLNLGDVVYFRHAMRRQNGEILAHPEVAARAIGAEILSSWWLIITLLILCYTMYLSLRFALRPRPPLIKTSGRLWLGRIFLSLGLLPLIVITARGGLQNRPLRPAMAFTSDNLSLGHLSLNSLYTVLWATAHSGGEKLALLPDSEARKLAQSLIASPDEIFLNPDYPFLRLKSPSQDSTLSLSRAGNSETTGPLNVVILIFESWNAGFTGAIRQGSKASGNSITPNFDSLATEGLLFTRFYATGDRSIHAFPAILASLPNLTGERLMHSTLETNTMRGIGSILKERNYRTVFAMGAAPSSMGFDSYAHACGFDRYLSGEDFPDEGPEFSDPNWGIFDGPFLGFLHENLNSLAEPFAAAFFSLTAHNPHIVPPSFARKHPLPDESGYTRADDTTAPEDFQLDVQLRSALYADHALGEFIRKRRTQPSFKRTVFVITADHTGFTRGIHDYTSLERFHVPLLIYAPGIVSPARDTLPASQADILPTLLDILGGPSKHSSLGLSLLAKQEHRIALMAKSAVYGFVYDSFYLAATADSSLALYQHYSDTLLSHNLIGLPEFAMAIQEVETAFRAYLQTGMNALLDNRIYPLPQSGKP